MKFGPVPLEQAAGKILGHNIAGPDGRRAYRKGKAITAGDIAALKAMGRAVVYAAELEPGDVNEDAAARRVADTVMGGGLRPSGPASGRVNLLAEAPGVARVEVERLSRLNDLDGISVATVTSHSAVRARQIAATIKIIPFAVPDSVLQSVEAIGGPIVGVLAPKRVGLILSGSPSVRERVIQDFDSPLKGRVVSLGSAVQFEDYVPLEDETGEAALAEALLRQKQAEKRRSWIVTTLRRGR
jgi:molybdenum cofactor cytidylyltransferase